MPQKIRHISTTIMIKRYQTTKYYFEEQGLEGFRPYTAGFEVGQIGIMVVNENQDGYITDIEATESEHATLLLDDLITEV